MKSTICTTRRSLLLATAAATAATAVGVHAQTFPARPVTLLVPLAAGSLADFLARAMAPDLANILGQPVVVENRPGAGEVVATNALLQSPATGHTLLLSMAPNIVVPSVQRTLPYKSVSEFAALGIVASAAGVLVVGPHVPAKNAKELVALMQAKPDFYKYGSSGIGSMMHLAVELFTHSTQTSAMHVPYKTFQAIIPDLITGQLDFALCPPNIAVQFADKGQLKIIGTQSLQRFPEQPNIPTLDEQGVRGYDTSIHYVVTARKATPEAAVKRLSEAISSVVTSEAFSTRIKMMGGVRAPGKGGSKEAADLLLGEETRWRNFIRTANITME